MSDAAIIAGFYGKLPARGDFVRAGLPRSFTDPWDDWLRSAIAGSRTSMGEAWLPAYLESPVWRFALPAGSCGPAPAIGLMLPSVDKAGRYFPLTFAALCDFAATAEAWLDRCEDAGLAALEQDIAPDAIIEMIGPPPDALRQSDRTAVLSGGTHWWTEGAPRVAATRLSLWGLPDAATYMSMLADGTEPLPAHPETDPMEQAPWESPS